MFYNVDILCDTIEIAPYLCTMRYLLQFRFTFCFKTCYPQDGGGVGEHNPGEVIPSCALDFSMRLNVATSFRVNDFGTSLSI